MENIGVTMKPPPVVTGIRKKIFRCPLVPCPFFCWTHQNYDTHLENQHFCKDCANYCGCLTNHVCTTPGARSGHVDAETSLDMTNFYELSRSHGGTVLMYQYNKPIESADIETTFSELKDTLKKFMEQLFDIHGHSKIEICLGIKMEKEINDDEGNRDYVYTTIYFKSTHQEMINKNDLDVLLMESASDLVEKKNKFLKNGSGWRIVRIESLDLKLGEIRLFQNVRGSGYLPMPLNGRRGFINFRNKDSLCFLYCVAAGLFWNEEESRTAGKMSSKAWKIWQKYFSRFNLTGITFPVGLDSISTFEENNNIRINVLTHRNQQVLPLRTSKSSAEKTITLFVIRKQTSIGSNEHYVLVTDVNKFLKEPNRDKRHFCQICFRSFPTPLSLDDHTINCKNNTIKEVFPKEDEELEFKRMEMTLLYPYVLYFDMECFSDPVHKLNGASTVINSEYKPANYSLCLVYNDGQESDIKAFEYYDGPRPIQHFYERAFHHSQNVIAKICNTNNFCAPSAEELERHRNATHCEFCKRKFTQQNLQQLKTKTKNVVKCYHHSHISGNYLHALCQPCNLKVKYKNELVCIAHNGSGFDFHYLLQNLESPLFDTNDVHVISKGGEKIVQVDITAKNLLVPGIKRSFDINDPKRFCGNRRVKLRFIDSFQFLPSSIDKLSVSLKKENSKSYGLLKKGFKFMFPHETSISESSMELLTEKLPYPYSYLTCQENLTDGHPIPSRSNFDNNLKMEATSDLDWDIVKKLIQDFHIKDFRQFTRVYTMIDTILLAIVWENFRMQCFESYHLEPTVVCIISGFSWQCFLFYSKVKIQYVRDSSMLELIKEGIRGGKSFCTQKLITANNEKSPLGYDPSKERTHLIYFDKVSLYGTALLEKYPLKDYQWVEKEELKSIDWKTYNGNENTGYILKVDLEYPDWLQDETVDLPLAPEKCRITSSELSRGQQQALKRLNLTKTFTSNPRLILHCGERNGYVLHYRALKYYLEMGMILKNIVYGFKFTEAAYFHDYIQFNINQRKAAQSESMRALFKAMLVAIFGKTLQSNKNLLETKFCSSAADSHKLISSSRCQDFVPITENLSMVLLRPTRVKLDKPRISGMTCLDLAKIIFYKGYYQELKPTFQGRITNLYMDTDSIIGVIQDPENSLWGDIVQNREFFDFSKIPKGHEIFARYAHMPDLRSENASVSGKWKIESLDISQLVTIKSKQYSILYFDNSEELKSKGIPHAALKTFSHNNYKSVVENQDIMRCNVKMIRSFQHRLYNITVNKLGFHCVDIYRVYPNPNDINFSLPLGHYKLKSLFNM